MGVASSRALLPLSLHVFLHTYSGFVDQGPDWASRVGKAEKI